MIQTVSQHQTEIRSQLSTKENQPLTHSSMMHCLIVREGTFCYIYSFSQAPIPGDQFKIGISCQLVREVITYIEFQSETSRKSSAEKVQTVGAAETENSATVKKPTMTADDVYKAKLAENRRLAREKAERESAEEKARAEDRKYDML